MVHSLSLQVIPTELLQQFKAGFFAMAKENFSNLHDSELSIDSFSFYTSVSAVFSSKIEGEDIDLDSFIRHKRFGAKYQPDYTRKIDDLYEAYVFAQQHQLSPQALEKAHARLTRHILQEPQQGKFRTGNMYVVTKDGRIEYVATDPSKVKTEMEKFYADMQTLLETDLDFEEVFFFASLLHLVLVKIHPFEDGNGRVSRLLEKWFLAEKLGDKAWYVQSERNYYDQHQVYFNNITRLRAEYDELNYAAALPFLQMLPASLDDKKDE